MNVMPAPLKLHALGGEAAPPTLAGDLRRLLRLPAAARAQLWKVLGPCLAEKMTPETEKLLDVFCAAHRITQDDLGPVLKACRFLVVEAARRDLTGEQLGEDLETLCPDTPALGEALLGGYDQAKAAVRQDIAVAALVGHGKLLLGTDWRIDTIEASAQGVKLRLPVAMLTFHYREGQETRRMTVQVLPDAIGQLKGICEQILS